MSRGSKFLIGLTAMLVCVPLPAVAGFYSWANPAGGNWESGANWQANTYPKYFFDFASFDLAGTYTVDATQASGVAVAAIDVTAGTVSLLAPDDLVGVLTVSGGLLSVEQGKVAANDGHLVGAGATLALQGKAALSGGTTRTYAVSVASGGFLYGNGSVDGNVVRNLGTVSAGSGPAQVGLLTLGLSSGGLDQRAGATLLAEVSAAGHDHIAALSASLAGNLEVAFLDGFMPQAGDTYTLLSSNTPILGSFDAVVWPEGGTFDLVYSDYAVDVVVVAVDAAAAPVSMDIKPGSCPNPLNVKSRGKLPVALMFPPNTDLEGLDPASVLLAGVPALRVGLEDVSSPVDSACGCEDRGPDGVMDMVLHFDTQAVVEALGDVEDEDTVMLELTGVLPDGTTFTAQDCVRVLKKGKSKGRFAAGLESGMDLWQDADAGLVYFRLPAAGDVRVTVHDIQGREVRVLTNEAYGPGQFTLPQPEALAAGVYFYRLESPQGGVTAKVVHLRR